MIEELNDIEKTLFVPLWGRYYASIKYPSLLYDEEAVRLIKSVEFDFDKITKEREYFNLASAIRAADFDLEIKKFINKFPNGTIINLGCGLDTSFYRIKNKNITWYDLDLPEIIKLREHFFKPNKQVKTIAKSFSDYSWIDDIEYQQENGILIIAVGLFYYFKKDIIQNLIKKISERFNNAVLIFDATSKTGIKISNRYVKKIGDTEALMFFSINNAKKELSNVSKKIKKVETYPIYSKTKKFPSWNFETKFKMFFSDRFNYVKIVKINF